MRVGISGMGRIGRLALRAAMGAAERQAEDPRAGNRLEIVHLSEIKGGAPAIAHLLEFDSVQGRWRAPIMPAARRRPRTWASTTPPTRPGASPARCYPGCCMPGGVLSPAWSAPP